VSGDLESGDQPHALTPADFLPAVLVQRDRASGLLLHPTSLPGQGGVGELGAPAFRFVEFLAAARQTRWQIMPLGPVGLGHSPYAAISAFAGNPLLIALDHLVGRGWLRWEDLPPPPSGPAERVDYPAAAAYKSAALRLTFDGFQARATPSDHQSIEAFWSHHASWLEDFALFSALKASQGGRAWFDWPADLRRREPAALAAARAQLDEAIRLVVFEQYLFFEQWLAVKRYGNERGIQIVGDIPIFLAHDSVDVWAHQEIFQLDERGQATVVSGVPPDLFSATGQRWGNPLYAWDRLAARGYDWWIERFRRLLELVDVVRLDHFRGFEAYWEVPGHEPTAVRGRWVPGPGAALFRAVEAALGVLPMFVEDLGVITEAVTRLRQDLGLPGMKVLQFAFAEEASNPYLPHNYDDPACVVYTGTHDNDTTVGWYASASERERDHVRRYLGVDGHDVAWDLIRCAFASVADTAIVPLQDVLALGKKARMNLPGNPAGNWSWRYREDQLRPDLAARLASLTDLYGRVPTSEPRP
jgi:4-alpha-glucanotransferase